MLRTLTIVSILLLAVACKKGNAEEGSAPSPAASSSIVVTGKRVDVTAGAEGFKPNAITLKKGEAATLVFTRTTNETCATKVVFPDLKLEKDLPLNQPVAVVVPVDQDKTYGFQCGMGMFKSKVVVQ